MGKIGRKKPVAAIFLLLVILIGLQTACSIPALSSSETPTPNISFNSPSPVLPSPTRVPATSTQVPTPIPSLTSPSTLTPTVSSPTPTALYSGIVAYDRQLKTITGFDLAGNPLDIKITLNGTEWIGVNEGQWANNSFYYVNKDEKAIFRIAKNGDAQKLGFIPASDALTFTISLDGRRIAWSADSYTGNNPSSELWVANIDGTNTKNITRIDPANNTKRLVLRPYRWLPDGRLLYTDSPTGIGGYILFFGFSGIHVFDPSNNKLTNLTPGLGSGGLCIDGISPDLQFITSTCGTNQPATLSYIKLADNSVISISRQAEQNQVGSPVWSPSGDTIAFAYARGDGTDEFGTVAVVANGGTSPKILGSVSKGFYNVKVWISEKQFLAQRYEGEKTSIWIFNQDGGDPQKLADGLFISLIQQ